MKVATVMRKICFSLGCFLLLCSELSYSLEMISGEDKTGRQILLLRDCRDTGTQKCEDYEKRIHKGDADRLKQVLVSNHFTEIWLASNGGDLMEGIEIGKILREKKQFVRVPSGARCVSACTVAFLGGVLRTIDQNATYEVHAYTSPIKDIPEMEVDPELILEMLAKHHAKDGREMAATLMIYYQKMLNGEPNEEAIRAATIGRLNKPIPYLQDGRLQRDITRFRSEKNVALQEIWMNMERESMALAIEDLKAVQNNLGKRAAGAIRILEIMFTSRITGTASLNRSTLREMGFVNVLYE
jgi:hypothetical protein